MEHISRWRVVLVATALVALGALGAGLVLANDPAGPPAGPAPAGDTGLGATGGTGAERPPGIRPAHPNGPPRLHGGGQRGQRLVHLEGTLDLPGLGIVQVALDHGTISDIGTGTISILEKDGKTVTLKTSDETKVRVARQPAKLSDLKVGDEVIVMSRLEDGSYEAYRIHVPPAQPAPTT
jgi:hypothetical protein